MHVVSLAISDIKLFTPVQHSDERGVFMETFRLADFCATIGQDIHFVQENQSISKYAHTVRGLHYQDPPYAQGKLVRCTRGRILDVAVDIRKNSPSYGKHVSAELSAGNAAQLWVPAGFLHGFTTLENDCEVQYKCTAYYSARHDNNILWNDPDLAINWGFSQSQAVLSGKDRAAPKFANFNSPFDAL